jgi:MFS family permease
VFAAAAAVAVRTMFSAAAGEFGCAMVYLHEIAPAKAKGFVGSIGFASAMVGCMLGVLIVVIVEAIFTPGEAGCCLRCCTCCCLNISSLHPVHAAAAVLCVLAYAINSLTAACIHQGRHWL